MDIAVIFANPGWLYPNYRLVARTTRVAIGSALTWKGAYFYIPSNITLQQSTAVCVDLLGTIAGIPLAYRFTTRTYSAYEYICTSKYYILQ